MTENKPTEVTGVIRAIVSLGVLAAALVAGCADSVVLSGGDEPCDRDACAAACAEEWLRGACRDGECVCFDFAPEPPATLPERDAGDYTP